MNSLINIDHSDKTFRVVTTYTGGLVVNVSVYLLSTGLKGLLTCGPNEDSVARAISRLKSSMTHTKDPLRNSGKPIKPTVANYGKITKPTEITHSKPQPIRRSLV
jgi:hypothetical protein